MKSLVKRNIIQHLGIIAGSIFFAMGYSWFLVPYKIAPGGIGGLGQILYHFFHIPIGVSMIMFNVPLFILSFIFLVKRFGVRSLFGMFTTSILTDLLSFETMHKIGIIKDLTPFTFTAKGSTFYAMLSPSDIYLSAIAGAALLGFGLGIIFRFKGSTGGTDIPVAFLKQKTGVSIGMGYWIVETLIILTIGIVFQDLKLIIWGYVNLFITSKITDLTSEGLPYVKGVYIISEKTEEIKEMIYDKINRGVTYLKAEGGYTGKPFNMLFCAMNRRQVAMVRDIVKDIDPKAFVLLTDVYDVMGYGFRSRNLDLQDNS
ncbi:MAG: YitT family protein [Candidatus Cloacimonetes bacterium]|nr:YitT family protein [Candidatus Cloacimonadota bacterium]MCF7813540.1 YitT family protein [Candidatus Cloacimonadota bacterium]MCF7869281.1 YitT family protein [Candidatus Cloacimonadota bacterium]MCF7884194.1 YitT family protein [Candidatus Cloacimonadota bacterium]